MVRDLWWKGLNEKVSFEFRVKEWKSDGWRKWKRERWVEISIKRWNWFTKWKWKFIPEMRWGILKRAIRDLQRRGGRWTSKCDNIRGTSIIVSLKRDEIAQIGCGENFVSKIDQFLSYGSSISSQWRDSRTGVMCEYLVVLATVRARELKKLLKSDNLSLRKLNTELQ